MIYFIGAAGSNKVKIGYAKDCAKRLREHQIGSPVPLHLIAEFDGDPSDERAAHRAIGRRRQSGEWFPRGDAMRLKRAMERGGLAALPAFSRWRGNERRSHQHRLEINRKAVNHTARRIATAALSSFSEEQMKAETGLSAASWRNALEKGNLPNSGAILNSLNYAPAHVMALVRFLTREASHEITDIEALECEPEIDAAMEALAGLKARCIAIRKARSA
jgi:hypothetical protein